jgi:hypothetical protein
MANSDYSMYTYYKGSDEYPNKKAEFFGFFEMEFEKTYEGKPEDKEAAFKTYMSHLLYKQAVEIRRLGLAKDNKLPKTSKLNCYKEYLDIYFNPDFCLEYYDRE